MNDMIRSSIIYIVRPSEIQNFIDEGLFQFANYIKELVQDTETILPHWYNTRCFSHVLPDKLQCIKLNNLHVILENTKHFFKEFTN